MYTPGSASEFEIPEDEGKETIKTPKSKSPQSKVSQHCSRLVNLMQCALYNTATQHKGKGLTILCSFPQQKTVTVTALPTLLFTEGQETHNRVLEPA